MRFRFIKLVDCQEASRWFLLASAIQLETPAALCHAGLTLYSFPGCLDAHFLLMRIMTTDQHAGVGRPFKPLPDRFTAGGESRLSAPAFFLRSESSNVFQTPASGGSVDRPWKECHILAGIQPEWKTTCLLSSAAIADEYLHCLPTVGPRWRPRYPPDVASGRRFRWRRC